MKCFVTGCAGFIGSHVVDFLLKNGHVIVGYDNLTTGQMQFLDKALRDPNFEFIYGDVLNFELLTSSMSKIDIVFHFAANADVRYGTQQTRKDLDQNTMATFHVLESMRINQIRKIVFASTGSIYGEAQIIPTPENASFPIQTSLYGASKLAAEGLIQAFCEGFGFQAYIFRFVSILGERYTHGHVFDFYKQLLEDSTQLHVLGDGKQKKSYLYVSDCIDAIFIAMQNSHERVNIFNLGVNDYCQVNDSIRWICEYLNLKPECIYSGGNRGWIGDNPFIFLDTKKICALGWKPKLSIEQGVKKTIQYLQDNQWILEARIGINSETHLYEYPL